MPIVLSNFFYENIVQNSWRPLSPCTLPFESEVDYSVDSYNHVATYAPEHRPKPANLTENLTIREKVYRREGKRGDYSKRDVIPCGHGTHAVHRVASNTGYLDLMHYGYNYDQEKRQLYWALPLRERMQSDRVNLGSSLAEYRESGKMFVSLAKGLHSAYKVLRGRMPRRKLRACSVPASVLQYNFGVAPLVGDLYSSIETLRQRMDRPLIRRSSVSIQKDTSGSGNFSNFVTTWKGRFQQRATIYYELSPNAVLSGNFDFGNPIEWAWELIPFSFVVDWAIPIGQWLAVLDALAGVSGVRGTVTTKTSESGKYYWDQANFVLAPGRFSNHSYERELIGSVPLPPLPRWKPSLTYRRILNGVSLLGSMSKTCRK